MDPLAITLNESLGKFLLSVPITISSVGTEVLVLGGGMPLQVNIKKNKKLFLS